MTRHLTPARARAELDSCGIGFVAQSSGESSRAIVELALQGLAGVRHRGAIAADGVSGDGAGLLVPIPKAFFARVAKQDLGVEVDASQVGVITAFFDCDDAASRSVAQRNVASALEAEGIDLLGWRAVPIDESHIGAAARVEMPAILHGILRRPTDSDGRGVNDDDVERRCYRARRAAERQCISDGVRHYFASWSFLTVTYKALVISDRLQPFYDDLGAEDFIAPFAIFHSRFSTNTAPAWERAQPFRFLCHNGEINTIDGNIRRMEARGRLGTVEVGLGPEDAFRPLFDEYDSDSGRLDNAVELLTRAGRDVRHAVAMLVPEAWEGHREVAPGVRDFYRYHASFSDPWDGPAGLVFTDGTRVGASLDRNGLRPLRWLQCDDGLVVVASEVGAVPLSGHGKIRRGRLGPGQMLCVDPDAGGLLHDQDIKGDLARQAPYGRWAADGLLSLPLGRAISAPPDPDVLTRAQRAFGLTKEDVTMVLKPMATDAKEPTFSMGDDTPFAAVSRRSRPVFHFLKQRFAQVSNPPIDHLRERLVMSLRTCLGPRQPLLTERPEAARLLELPTFFLYPNTVSELLDAEQAVFAAVELDATFDVSDGAGGLEAALERISLEALHAIEGGVGIIVISDGRVSDERVPVPSLLALGAVHHRLIDSHVRQLVSLVVDSGDVREVHGVACLLGYGADAVCPRLALESVAAMADDDQLGELHSADAQAKYQAGVEDGVLKIFAKMGISTVEGYRSAQIFEVIGLGPSVIHRCLRETTSTVGGIGFAELGLDALSRHQEGFAADVAQLDEPGWVRFRKRGGDYHANNPEVADGIHAVAGVETEAAADAEPKRRSTDKGSAIGSRVLEHAGGPSSASETIAPLGSLQPAPPEEQGSVMILGPASIIEPVPAELMARPDPVDLRAAHVLQRAVKDGRSDLYDQFRNLVESRPTTELHDLLEILPAGSPIPLEEVEPIEAITRRFSTGAMSHGSLSKEAHETIAVAMNLIGGKSNCGEGGEDPARFRTRGQAVDKNSRIKQIASGRFGVTPEYCAFADELNIKIAQGSKPGEGGQLPGHKVSAEIARLRHTQPGVGLISPPPHHDIYSIEDLAQLIFDLKQVNPRAAVSVKLVAEAGIGTIAAGVVKALADVVQVSGANGGTGASPLSSIKHAGMPWELGIAETQQALVENALRDRVRLRVDGGFKTGRDVLVAALLGADEYSFGTAVMIAEGCIMVRACHRDTCPTGIATQRTNLRRKFAGTPEGVAQYLLFVAEEVRSLLAQNGLRSLDDAIGRVELLTQRVTGDARTDSLDLAPLLCMPGDAAAPRHFVAGMPIQRPRSELDEQLYLDAFGTLWEGGEITLDYTITGADRAIGASLGGAIGLEWGRSLPAGSVKARFAGTAGQSFGAFLADGVTLDLIGEANDYVGKGQGGGRIVVRPPADDAGDPVLAGNTVLYGATGGQLFVAGRVGERFAVRNSGATAVVEGTGDHACEYMTGGTVLILGPFGYNLGAGMTGGRAFIVDEDALLAARLNRQLVDAVAPDDEELAQVRELLEEHRGLTGSRRAAELLADWQATSRFLWRVAPLSEVVRIERANEGLLGTSR